MPGHPREELDKKEIGARIKRLRKEAGLRQWQLAEMIGATQPAIHMYERGVLPEPRRILELARIGDTTVEWILTGRHWENGSTEMRRVPQDVCHLAFQLKEYGPEDRETLESALRTIHAAVQALRKASAEPEKLSVDQAAGLLKDAGEGTLHALSAAMQALQAVQKALVGEGASRYKRLSQDSAAGAADPDAGRKRRGIKMRAASIEPLRGNIFRADGSFLVINDILRDKDLREELEDALARLSGKLESKRSKVVKLKKAQRAK
ncbi:MAG TPA: helix-turn-helix transcriptional regulator [Candidatus Polarisedimenticolia bacterium]|nr:helix-turn-helix transcriptional regulator [Candidatus Polarisedimenticolia bacterium]